MSNTRYIHKLKINNNLTGEYHTDSPLKDLREVDLIDEINEMAKEQSFLPLMAGENLHMLHFSEVKSIEVVESIDKFDFIKVLEFNNRYEEPLSDIWEADAITNDGSIFDNFAIAISTHDGKDYNLIERLKSLNEIQLYNSDYGFKHGNIKVSPKDIEMVIVPDYHFQRKDELLFVHDTKEV